MLDYILHAKIILKLFYQQVLAEKSLESKKKRIKALQNILLAKKLESIVLGRKLDNFNILLEKKL